MDAEQLGRPLYSRGRMLLVTLAGALLIFAINLGLDYLLIDDRVSGRLTIEISDLLGAVIVGFLFYRVLAYEREKRSWLRQRIEIIAEMNHYVRNGLQAISLSAASPADEQRVAALREGINRIQYALKEILPKL